MKSFKLILASLQLISVAALMTAAVNAESLGLVAIYGVAGLVNIVGGTNGVCEALFGKDGLVCEVFPSTVK